MIKSKKFMFVLSMLLVVSVVLAACAPAAPAAPAAAEEPAAEEPVVEEAVAEEAAVEEPAAEEATLRIAFIPQLIGIPYFTAMEEGGYAAAEKFGGEFMYVGSPTANAAEQVRLMENLIEQKVDAISISVLDAASLNPVIKKASEAGIAVYTSDSDSPDSERQIYVAQSTDKDLGYTLIDELVKNIGGAGQIAIVSGESTATNLNAWIGFMKERVDQEYPDVEIVDTRYTTGGSSEDALRQAEELMTRFPDLKGLVAGSIINCSWCCSGC